MRIAFTPTIFSLQQYGGISRYFMELATRLATLPDTEVGVLAFAHVNAYLANSKKNCIRGVRVPSMPNAARLILAEVNQLIAGQWLKRNPVDIVHDTYYTNRSIAPESSVRIMTVFDLIHERFPEHPGNPGISKVLKAKQAAIRDADHIICISENTRRDLLASYASSPEKATVVHLGFSLQSGVQIGGMSPESGPYILFVGKRGGYKNFATLIEAYASSKDVMNSHKLVCFGDAAFSAKELSQMAHLGINSDQVRHVVGDDEHLARYYKHAALFIYPSRYEGFGIPPLEAMSLDCPVACSNTSSLPEVVGNAARTFDPDDYAEIAAAMEFVLSSPERANELRKRGKVRTSLFSWDLCAEKTRAAYTTALRNKAR